MHTVDFLEAYAPTLAASSVKLFLPVAVENNQELQELYVKQVFIQADLDLNVFMELPDGCGDKSGRVVKVNKSVYSVKQAGRRWEMCRGIEQ